MTDVELSEDSDRYSAINRFKGLKSVQRYETLAFLIWRNNWKRGAELGVHYGSTSEYLFQRFPHLNLIGVDFFAYPPLKVGGPPKPPAPPPPPPLPERRAAKVVRPSRRRG